MTFGRYLHLCSTLLILTGFYSILITGAYLLPVAIGIATTVAYWALGDRLPRMLPVPKAIWNGVAVGYIVYLVYETFWGEQDLVGNGIKFVVYLQVVKLLSPKTNRDQLQIYLLSFLHILASTVISNDISFSLPFLIYVVLATWTLAMFNLKVELERCTDVKKAPAAVANLFRSREIITRRFLAFTSALSIAIIAFTLLVFFSFPRVSFGNFLKRIDTRQRVSGFSENVELGSIGNIKANSSVSLRVEIKPEDMAKIDVERLYWRGTSSDTFDGRRWRRSTEGYQPVRIDTYGGVLTLGRAPSWKGRPISYRVFLEALNPPILFGADRLLRIVWDKPLIEKIFRGTININQDAYGGTYLSGTRVFAGDLTYSAESFLGQPSPDQLRKVGRKLALGLREPFLQLPTLDPKVVEVMKRMQGNRSTPYDTATAIQQFLENHYKYTLNVQDTGVEDPLRFFLVDKKRGHCEYFSTALVIALRVAGIPSRHVVGYRGGEYNPYGGYVAVRQSDAHSWVEAYFVGAGWVRMDPSPLDSTIAFKKEYFKALNQFVDYLRLRWNKYIIEYDLRAQATLFETIGRRLFILAQRSSHDRDAATDGKPDAAERLERAPLLWILGGLVFCGALWVVLRSEGRRRRKLGRLKGLLRILKRAGFEKSPAETPMELAQRVERKVGELPELQEIVRIYYDERFGARGSDTERWKTKLAALSAALRRRSTSRSL